MEEENKGDEVTLEPQEEQTSEQTPEPQEESVDWEAKAKKAEELAKNYKIRAEKAEQEAKKKPVETETPKNDLSLKDYKALSDIHDDDVDDVVEWAKFKKITIAEAKQSDHIQALLKDKSEKRQVAGATNTGSSKRVNTQNTGNEVLAKFEKTGQLPESDKDMELLAKAQFDRKIRK